MDSPKFAKFDISTVAYKVVNSDEINAFIVTPKGLSVGKHPVIVKFHGGFFVTGASLYSDWFPQWALDFSVLHSAIIVTPDYRLIPESKGLDILSDITDFWIWLRNDLQHYLQRTNPGIEADLEKIIAYGESAGGHLAILSGMKLAQPSLSIKAVIATYPLIDINAKLDKPILGAPKLPVSLLQDFENAMEPGKIITSAIPPARMPIALSIAQQQRMSEFFGTDNSLYPMEVLDQSPLMPYTLILHGEDDTGVPVEGSIKFATAAEKKFGDKWGSLVVQPGEHGFDATATLDTPWLKDGLSKVTEKWLHD